MGQGLPVDGSMAWTKVFPLQQYCRCCEDPPKTCPHGASCTHGTERMDLSPHTLHKSKPLHLSSCMMKT